MKKNLTCALAMLVLTFNLAPAQTKKHAGSKSGAKEPANNFQLAAAGAVTGSGTTGRLSKWAGVPGSSILGDSNVTEDKFGKIGIGTPIPTSQLTVQGMIETTIGGYKFPDGTIQSTAFSGGVEHDQTLRGMGTAASPLGLAVPLILDDDVEVSTLMEVINRAAGGSAIFAFGGPAGAVNSAGTGLAALGGIGAGIVSGGVGVVGLGGPAPTSSGGTGGSFRGGESNAGSGGDGLSAFGALGMGAGHHGGSGIVASPGGGAGGATAGLAGEFLGDVEVSGTLSKGGGSFKIDHPLDPENKYLYHSFVESPDMMNIYNGNITTDEAGEAVVELPGWFEALNKSFRYQLTVIGTFAQAIVAEKVKGNRFTIRTNAPNVEVSWQVTGIRKDGFADKHRIPVEQDKPQSERGAYLHPEAYDRPEEMGIAWRRNREATQRLKTEGDHLKSQQPKPQQQ